jgi:hypothetical protein
METVLIYAGIPAAVIAAVYGVVYAGGTRRDRRYRPGRPFEFRPVWFLSAPELSAPDRLTGDSGHRAVGATADRAALGTADRAALGTADRAALGGGDAPVASIEEDRSTLGATGGASDNW